MRSHTRPPIESAAGAMRTGGAPLRRLPLTTVVNGRPSFRRVLAITFAIIVTILYTTPARHPRIIQASIGRPLCQELIRELCQIRIRRGELLEHDHIAVVQVILDTRSRCIPAQEDV